MASGAKGLDQKVSEMQSKIARAAAKLFNKRGYLSTTIDDIAALMNVSKGSVYYYFKSKEEILFFIIVNYLNQILENCDAQLGKIQDPVSRLRFFISRHVEYFVNNFAEAKTLLHEGHCLSRKNYAEIVKKQRQYYRIASNLVSDLSKNKANQSKDEVTVATFLLFGMSNWIYSWYDPKKGVTPEELSQMIWKIYAKGVTGYFCSNSKLEGRAVQKN